MNNSPSIDASLFYALVDDTAQAVVAAGKTRELQQLIQGKSRKAVQSQRFRAVLYDCILKHLSHMRGGKTPSLSRCPLKLADAIRRVSIFALSRSLSPSLGGTQEMTALVSPELDRVQCDDAVIMEFSTLVLRRIAKILQEREES